MVARFRSWLRALVGRQRFEDAMAEELRSHIEPRTGDLIRQGVPPHGLVPVE